MALLTNLTTLLSSFRDPLLRSEECSRKPLKASSQHTLHTLFLPDTGTGSPQLFRSQKTMTRWMTVCSSNQPSNRTSCRSSRPGSHSPGGWYWLSHRKPAPSERGLRPHSQTWRRSHIRAPLAVRLGRSLTFHRLHSRRRCPLR